MKRCEYTVVPMGELVESPKWLSLADTKVKQIVASLTKGLNDKDSEGWELVTIYYATLGTGFAVFKKERGE